MFNRTRVNKVCEVCFNNYEVIKSREIKTHLKKFPENCKKEIKNKIYEIA